MELFAFLVIAFFVVVIARALGRWIDDSRSNNMGLYTQPKQHTVQLIPGKKPAVRGQQPPGSCSSSKRR